MRPPNQTFQATQRHPLRKSGDPYSQDMRELVVATIQDGRGNDPFVHEYRHQRKWSSKSTSWQWIQQNHRLGHHRAMRRTGNRQAMREVNGFDLFMLCLYRAAFPRATHAEINAFLFQVNHLHNLNFRFFSGSQLSRAERSVWLTTKRSSASAYQAFLPANILKRWCFWNLPYPFGIANIPARDLVDVDECGVTLEGSVNRTVGKEAIGETSNEEGPYQKSRKTTLAMGILADPELPERFAKMWSDGGTTIDRFEEFIEEIIDGLERVAPGRRFCFIMDNLSAHKNARIKNLIYGHGHRLAFRAPYYAVDGPIEYVFNTIQCLLRVHMRDIVTQLDLQTKLEEVIASIPTFAPYFHHCGFVR